MKMKFKPLIPAALAALVLAAPAQDEADGADKPYVFESQRNLRFSCLAADNGVPALYYRSFQREEGQEKPVIAPLQTSAPFSMRGTLSPYNGPARIEFFDEEPPPGPPFDEEGERVGPKPMAVTNLPANEKQLLLLFVPLAEEDQKDGLIYRIILYDDSLDKLPFGSYRLINFTKRPLVAMAGSAENRINLRPNAASPTIRPGGPKRNLEWRIYDPNREGKKLVYQSMWTHRPTHRLLVFITESRTQRGGLHVKPIHQWEEELAGN